MAEKQAPTLFRKKAMERIASPEDLTSYLRVTNPGVWNELIEKGGFFADLVARQRVDAEA